MFQLSKPSVKLWERVCVCILFRLSPFWGFKPTKINRETLLDTLEDVCLYLVHTFMCSLCFIYNPGWTTKSSQQYVNLLSHCGGEREGGRWDRLGWEWIRMATHVAQLLLKGLFITVRSLLAPSPLLSPSSVLTRPHLNNGPNTKKHVVCVEGVLGGVGLHVPLIFRSASLLIKAAITT